ncbi:hypothetical protein HK102_012468, partial [Quaeritorhiza haematococci]
YPAGRALRRRGRRARSDRRVARAAGRRGGQGPSDPRSGPRPSGRRGRRAPPRGRGTAGARTLRGVRRGGPAALPGPGLGPLQGRIVARLGRGASRPPVRGRVRQRQAHDVQRLLHQPGRHRRRVLGPVQARCARRRGRAGTRLRLWELPQARPERHAVHRRRTRFDLGPHREGAAPRARRPHRELPGFQASRGGRRGRQPAVRRPEAGIRRTQAFAARLLLRQIARRLEARRNPGARHLAIHARQARRRRARIPGRTRRFPGSDPAPERRLRARGDQGRDGRRLSAKASPRRASQARRGPLAQGRAARRRGLQGRRQPILPGPSRDGPWALEREESALRRRRRPERGVGGGRPGGAPSGGR